MFTFLTEFINQRFDKFLTARVPEARQFTLTNKNIFIFPSRMGFAYLVVVILLFLLGTNYQNNVIMLLSYLMASFFVTITLTSFFNVKGLKLKSDKFAHGFVEQPINLPVTIETPKPCFDLSLCFEFGEKSKLTHIKKAETINVQWQADFRGIVKPGRVKLTSEYAFGLLTVWSWLDFGHELTIFPTPRPITNKQLSKHMEAGEQGSHHTNMQAGDEFQDLSSFKEGESLARVAWKQLARGQGKFSKNYHQAVGEAKFLSFEALPPVPVEQKLEYLAYLILQYAQADSDYGLVLPNERIAINRGEAHKLKCLYALAKYPVQIGQ